jgi:DNA-directed RNA polymerase specialized sigma24 family protein
MNMSDEEWLDFFLSCSEWDPVPTPEQTEILRLTYCAMPLRVRVALRLHKGLGYTQEAVAGRLEVTAEQVKRYLTRATEILAKALERGHAPVSFPVWKEMIWELPLIRSRYTPSGDWPSET